MESLYAEASVKQKTTARVTMLKMVLVIGVILLLAVGFLSGIRFLVLPAVAGGILLVWYWPRFKIEWEYVFCDGQLDFDRIQGGEKRKTILRIELEDADVIAPMDSHRMDGYRHLPVRDFSSLQPDSKPYGIVVKAEGREEKVVLVFEPSEYMLDRICFKYPSKTERREGSSIK